MSSAIQRLTTLTVADVMNRDVVEVHRHQAMEQVARVFRDRHVTAAPVVDDQGRCVGVISAADFVRRESESGGSEPSGERQPHGQHRGESEEPPVEASADDSVSSYMTRVVHTVVGEVSLLLAARIMCAEHVHRLFVLDEAGRPVGVVSTMDIVAAMMHAIEEMGSEPYQQSTG